MMVSGLLLGFETLNLKEYYDTDEDNVLQEFYIPTLSKAVRYSRLTGSFSSSVFKIASHGIAGLIKNNGKLRIIASLSQLKKNDVDVLTNVSRCQIKATEVFFSELNANVLARQMVKDSLSAFAWMLSKEIIEFKIAIPMESNGMLSENSMFHHKIGILDDNEGNFISFSGSINESLTAWIGNIEEFKVFKSWIPSQRVYLERDIETFEKYWSGEPLRTKIIPLPKTIEEKILEYKPKSKEELLQKLYKWEIGLLGIEETKRRKQPISEKLSAEYLWRYDVESLVPRIEILRLRNCQKAAHDYLKRRSYIGILCMATGSGKTLSALFTSYHIVQNLNSKHEYSLVLIAVPDLYLVRQWSSEIRQITRNYLEIHGENPSWRTRLKTLVENLLFKKTHLYIVGSLNSLNFDFFHYIIYKLKVNEQNIVFIADEVHRIGAPQSRNNLRSFSPKFKIGLSATPHRMYDNIGNEFITNFFNISDSSTDVFTYSLKEAQNDGYLVEFEYIPLSIYLEDSEFKDYSKLSKKISKASRLDKENEINEIVERLSQRRALILKKATNKLDSLYNLLLDLMNEDELLDTVIYTEDFDQLNSVKNILKEFISQGYHIYFSVFDGSKHLKERKTIIKNSSEGQISLILAMKCLDQGVDIPSLSKSIFLSSSSNPLQHIQRAGRVLRTNKDKTIARIFDFIVVPTRRQLGDDPVNAQKIIERERIRSMYFAENSLLKYKAILRLKKIFEGDV